MYYTAIYSSPFGEITLASDGTALTGAWFEGQKYHGSTIFPDMKKAISQLPVFAAAVKWLDQYFKGERPAISQLPLAPAGSQFRQTVWQLLCEIPYGKVITYGDIARKMAALMDKKTISAQAVGGAVGHNPLSIIIPCHRVIGANGTLTGYAAGIEIKKRLLEWEDVDLGNLQTANQIHPSTAIER